MLKENCIYYLYVIITLATNICCWFSICCCCRAAISWSSESVSSTRGLPTCRRQNVTWMHPCVLSVPTTEAESPLPRGRLKPPPQRKKNDAHLWKSREPQNTKKEKNYNSRTYHGQKKQKLEKQMKEENTKRQNKQEKKALSKPLFKTAPLRCSVELVQLHMW